MSENQHTGHLYAWDRMGFALLVGLGAGIGVGIGTGHIGVGLAVAIAVTLIFGLEFS